MIYRPDIDGLRAVSVTLVVLFHYGCARVTGGFVGVDVFFVISGFLITSILATATPSIAEFYARRVRRIIPALLFVIGTTLLVGHATLPGSERAELDQSAFYSSVSLANFYFLANTGYFDTAADLQPLLHIWSLAVEEQFYMVWPFLFLGLVWLTRGRPRLLLWAFGLLIAVSFAVSVHRVFHDKASAFFLPDSRAWEFGVGALLAMVPPLAARGWMSELMPLSGLAMIAYSALTLTGDSNFPGLNAALPCVGAGLVVCRTTAPGVVAAALGSSPVRFVGLISYSLYLWHWPVLVFFRHWNEGGMPSTLEATALGATSVVLSVLTWKYIETPFRRWRPGLSAMRGLAMGFAAVTAAGITAWMIQRQSDPLSAEELIVREQLTRAATIDIPDLAFFGDSSCLTGIHSPTLSKLLGKSVASFCMFGSAGPLADARALELLLERGAPPRAIVIVLHPRNFSRRVISSDWASFIAAQGPREFASAPPDAPLKGAFAARYHRVSSMVSELKRSGSLVDPASGLGQVPRVTLEIPASYAELIAPLVSALKTIDRRKVYLMFPPLPPGAEDGDRAQAANTVTRLLGISQSNFLPTPAVQPVSQFATDTHLNERGRAEFTAELAKIIKARIPLPLVNAARQ